MISLSWQLISSAGASSGADLVGRDLELSDVDGDLLVLDNELQLVRGSAAVASDLISRLRTFQTEYFLDTSIGVEWLAPPELAILGGKPNPSRTSEIFRREAEATPGVIGVLTLEVTVSGRTLSARLDVRCDTSEAIRITLELALGGN